MQELGMVQWIKSTRKLTLSLLIVLMFAALNQRVAAQQYQVTYLDDLGGNSRGNSINDRGWIAGFSINPSIGKRHAVLWRDAQSILDLGTLGTPDKNSNVAWPVKNNRGFIAGVSQTNTPEPNGESWSCAAFFGGQTGYTCLGFLWENNLITPLHPLAGGNNSFATGADNKGRIVGWAENGIHDTNCVGTQVLQFRPVIWDRGGPAQALPLFATDSSGAATAINNRGQIVGISGICDQAVGRRTAKHALLWDNGTITNLGNLGAELWITPMAINEHGDIVGFGATDSSDLNGDFLRGFIWTQKDGIKQIDPLAGHVFSQANSINERGQVVGSSCDADGACQGFLWQDNVLKNLNDLVPGFNGFIVNAQDINDEGEITGRAFNPSTGKITAFVAVPVEETGRTSKPRSPTQRAQPILPAEVRLALRQQRGLAGVVR